MLNFCLVFLWVTVIIVEDKLPAAVDRSVDFVVDVQPILREHCYECHTTGNEEGGLHLGLRARAMEGGISGVAIRPGNSSSSRLINMVTGLAPHQRMPPDGEGLTVQQIGILRAWIDQGLIGQSMQILQTPVSRMLDSTGPFCGYSQ